jgi:hypothetical protein
MTGWRSPASGGGRCRARLYEHIMVALPAGVHAFNPRCLSTVEYHSDPFHLSAGLAAAEIGR